MKSTRRLADVSTAGLRRALATGGLFLVVAVLFVLMVRHVFVAAALGVIFAAYVRPFYDRLARGVRSEAAAAVLTVLALLGSVGAIMGYAYAEVYEAAEYLAGHAAEVAGAIDAAIDALPFVGEVQAEATIERGLDRAAAAATEVPAGVQGALSGFAVALSVFLFTVFYVLTHGATIVAYIRAKVPARYGDLAERLEEHVRGVLFGAIYGTVVTQSLKALLILVLALVFGVPLPVVLALAAFVIGFFPVVGSWTVYLPAAGYLLVFQDAPWEALAMVAIAAVGNTIVLSLLVRPRLAADASHVLDFYWMFIGLVAGVYAFGVPGIVLGPILVGLGKVVLDTVTSDAPWMTDDDEEGDEAEIVAEEKLVEEPAPEETDLDAGESR